MIGVFDSGFGGLTVCQEIIKEIPGQDIIFFADIGNFPYGSKTPDQLRNFSRNILDFLINQGAEVIVVACNSASSVIDESFRNQYDLPILDVISSGVRGLTKSKYNKLGLIATEATINSGVLEEKINQLGIEVISKPAPELVELAQSMKTGREADELISKSLEFFKDKQIDGFYLGCTHYSLIKEEISKELGCEIIDPAVQTTVDLSSFIQGKEEPTKFYYYSSAYLEESKNSVRNILANDNVIVR